MTADDRYKGEDGGLYGGGKNEPPPALAAAAKRATAAIQPLDADGKPSAEGIIGLVSISMSNATQEFSYFKQIADKDPAKSPRVVIVDCAQGGQAMAQWVSPRAPAWAEADRRLSAAHVSPNQVQVAWIKLANVGPTGDLAEHGKKLEQDTQAVLQNAKSRFPNLQNRVSRQPNLWWLFKWPAQSGTVRLRRGLRRAVVDPRSNARERGAELRSVPRPPSKPHCCYGDPIFGPTASIHAATTASPGMRTDLGPDGTHPSQSGREKVAAMLLKFFKNDALAKTWFTKQ